MSNKNNQKQWLNIVIITISTLILALTLLGRFIEKGVDKAENKLAAQSSEQSAQQAITEEASNHLVKIDFGRYQWSLIEKEWRAAPAGESVIDMNSVIERWQLVLDEPLAEGVEDVVIEPSKGQMVLLYLSNSEMPLVVKIETGSKAGQAGLLLSFVAHEQFVWLPETQWRQLVPINEG
jgi:hypothetical protein